MNDVLFPWHWRFTLRLLIIAAALAAGWQLFSPAITFLSQEDPSADKVAEDFYNGHVSHPQSLRRVTGFEPGPYGWYLPPGQAGELIYRVSLERPATRDTYLNLGLNLSPPVRGKASLSADGHSYTTLAQNRSLDHLTDRLPVGGLVAGHRTFYLKVAAEAPHNLRPGEDTPGAHIFYNLRVKSFASPPPTVPAPAQAAAGLAWFGVTFSLLSRRGYKALPIIFIMAAGLFLRWSRLDAVAYGRAEPDALAYRQYIDRFTFSWSGDNGFYSGNFNEREPLFLAAGKAFFFLFGSSDTHLRLLSLFLSVAAIYAYWRLARRIFDSDFWGWLTALLLAVNIPLIVESARGLRLELELLLLAPWAGSFFAGKRFTVPKAAWSGLLGGLLALTRFYYLPVHIIAALYAAFSRRHRRAVKKVSAAALTTILIALLLALPHKYGLYKTHGSFNYDTQYVTRWFANVEFAGQPGFPSQEEVGGNAYLGNNVSYLHYVFGLHSFSEVAGTVISGYQKAWRNFDLIGYTDRFSAAGFIDIAFTAMILAGLIYIAANRRDLLWLPLLVLLLLAVPIFPYGRGLLEKYRHLYHVFPLAAIIALLGTRFLLNKLSGYTVTVQTPKRSYALRLPSWLFR